MVRVMLGPQFRGDMMGALTASGDRRSFPDDFDLRTFSIRAYPVKPVPELRRKRAWPAKSCCQNDRTPSTRRCGRASALTLLSFNSCDPAGKGRECIRYSGTDPPPRITAGLPVGLRVELSQRAA